MSTSDSIAEKYRSQTSRLQTYTTRVLDDHVPAIPLVVAGFVQEMLQTFDPSGQFWCPWCDLRLRDMEETDSPVAWHHVFSGNCPFLTRNDEIDVKDLGLEFPALDMTTEETKFFSEMKELSKPIYRKQVTDEQEVRKLYKKLNKLGKIVPASHLKIMDKQDTEIGVSFEAIGFERRRRNTFEEFEQAHIVSVKSLSTAGFYCSAFFGEEPQLPNRVVCAFCDHGVMNTLEGSSVNDGYDLHRSVGREIETCPLIAGKTCQNVPDLLDDLYQEEVRDVLYEDLNEKFNLYERLGENVKFGGMETRMASFKNWPLENCKTKEEMLGYQLHYTHKDDVVSCFYCSETFTGYKAEDDLWEIHASKSPNCVIVRRNKSLEFAKDAKTAQAKKAKEIRAITPHQLEMSMSTPVTQLVLYMEDPSFDRKDVEKQIIKNFNEGKSDYESAAQLVKDITTAALEEFKKQEKEKPLTGHIPKVVSYPRPELFKQKPEDEKEEAKKKLTAPSKAVWGSDVDELGIAGAVGESLDDLACMLCLENIRSTLLLPCGDFVCCLDCAFGTKSCPQCRKLITGVTICEMAKL